MRLPCSWVLAPFWIGSTGLYLRGTIRLQEIDYHEEYGEGVVDNWSDASLLPSLFESLESQALKHTFRFMGFAEEEKGLIGAALTVLSPIDSKVWQRVWLAQFTVF